MKDAKYHSIEAQEASGDKKNKAQKECEAESIAMVCAAHYGIDTGDYSFGYVAGWSSGKETPELKESLQTIRQGACEIIDAIDKRIQELTYDRVEASRAPADLGIDMAEFERITADCPFGKAEVDLPEGFIKIEPPFDPNSLKKSATIELNDTAKTEEKKEKSSVREKLEAKKVVKKLSKQENLKSNANKKHEREI